MATLMKGNICTNTHSNTQTYTLTQGVLKYAQGQGSKHISFEGDFAHGKAVYGKMVYVDGSVYVGGLDQNGRYAVIDR